MDTSIFDLTEPSGLSTEELGRRLVGYSSQITALTGRFLRYLAEFDDRHGWSGAGILSCAHWLSWKTGLSLRTAQEQVRVAHALESLPMTRAAMEEGALSYSKARAISRVATPEREEELVRAARSATAAQTERICAAVAGVDRTTERAREEDNGETDDAEDDAGKESAEAQPADRPPSVRGPESSAWWEWNPDGTLSATVRFTALDGARLLAAVVHAEYDRVRTDADSGLDLPPFGDRPDGTAGGDDDRRSNGADLWASVPCNLAPALLAMADAVLSGVSVPEVAVGAELLIHEVRTDEGDAVATVDDGPGLRSAERDEARCGCSVREVVHADQIDIDERTGAENSVTVGAQRLGAILWWGRRRRTANAALVALMKMRDHGCRAPGCGRTRHLHVHHVRFWSLDGTTDPDNLILLCSRHHRMLHLGDFSIEALGRQMFAFRGKRGEVLESVPIPEVPEEWNPWRHVRDHAVSPTDPGPLDLEHTISCLYSIWEWRERQLHRTERPAEPAAAA
jgi:hypothetical protein